MFTGLESASNSNSNKLLWCIISTKRTDSSTSEKCRVNRVLRQISLRVKIKCNESITEQMVFVHNNRASLQLAILYEMLKDQCEEVNKEGPKVKSDRILRRISPHDVL